MSGAAVGLAVGLGMAMASVAFPAQRVVFPGKHWARATPQSQGVDPAKLNKALAFLAEALKDNGGIDEALLVRNGYVIWSGERTDVRHSVWSCTKSFTSTVLGLLIEDGKCTLDTPAKNFLPELAAQYPNVTLRHFATMTSGYDAVGGRYGDDPLDGSKTPFKPTTPMFPPGTMYRYWDDAMRMFGKVLTRIAGEPLDALFNRRVADPIGMDPRAWRWKTIGEVDGIPIVDAAGGMEITARELARFGLLYLNRGNWAGKQLISAQWVAQATAVQVPPNIPFQPISPRQERIDGRGVYGFNWWVNGTKHDGTRKWPGAPPATYAASGFNQNKCFVVPDWNIVFVRTGTKGSPKYPENPDQVWGTFLRMLGEALVDI